MEKIIQKDGVTYTAKMGYGRMQKARYIFNKNLPESVKRKAITESTNVFEGITPEEVLDYNAKTHAEILSLVLESASDWDKSSVTTLSYIDSQLPEDVGNELVQWVSDSIAASRTQKKDSNP